MLDALLVKLGWWLIGSGGALAVLTWLVKAGIIPHIH